jgi:hypothetical protein
MFSFLVIAIGFAVLAFGRRLAVLGAAVGALLGVGLLSLFPGSATPLTILLIPGLLAVIGFFVAGFAKGIVDIVLLVLGALAGAAIMLGFLNLFNIPSGLLLGLLVVLGGVIGLIMVRRFKKWAMIILAGLIGGLLVTRGLTDWFPVLEGAFGTLLVLVLAGGSIAYQGRFSGKDNTAAG